MGEVRYLDIPTRLDVPVPRVCDGARERCRKVLILGEDHEGQPYYAASFADGDQALELIEAFRQWLREQGADV